VIAAWDDFTAKRDLRPDDARGCGTLQFYYDLQDKALFRVIVERDYRYIRSIKYIARFRVHLAELAGCNNDGNPKRNLYNHLAILQLSARAVFFRAADDRGCEMG
jgi:hypothetical protein